MDKIALLVSDKKGRVRDVGNIEAAGMKGGCFFRMAPAELIELPGASRLFMLPDRMPVGYDPVAKKFVYPCTVCDFELQPVPKPNL
jgi:hypothetical protein